MGKACASFIIYLFLCSLSILTVCQEPKDDNHAYFKHLPRPTSAFELEPTTLRCSTKREFEDCSWEVKTDIEKPREDVISLKKHYDYLYEFQKTSSTNCNIKIKSVSLQHHGLWRCCPKFRGETSRVCSDPVKVTVLKPLRSLQLSRRCSLDRDTTCKTVMKENDHGQMTCQVKNARPRPIASWYLCSADRSKIKIQESPMQLINNERSLKYEGVEWQPKDYSSILNRTWEPDDNRKKLRCVVHYPHTPEYTGVHLFKRLNVTYKPILPKTLRVTSGIKRDAVIRFRSNPPPSRNDVRIIKNKFQAVAVPGEETNKYIIGRMSCEDDWCSVPIEFKDRNLEKDFTLSLSVLGEKSDITVYVFEPTRTSISTAGLVTIIIIVVVFIVVFLLFCYWKRNPQLLDNDTEEETKEKEASGEKASMLKSGN